MAGRMCMLAFIAAVASVQTLTSLPAVRGRWTVALVAATAALVAAVMHRRRSMQWLALAACCLCAAALGAMYAIERGQSRLDDRLSDSEQNQVRRLTVRVASLVQRDIDALRFEGEVQAPVPVGIPSRIAVLWPLPTHHGSERRIVVLPGQHWRMAVVLKQPHTLRNPHAADGEARLFQRNIRATAVVRGRPKLQHDEGWRLDSVAVHRTRHLLREAMLSALHDRRYGAVIVALALGDQAGVAAGDWQVFNATGITHLVSISGLHVTLVAGLAGLAVSWVWRRLRWRGVSLAERRSAQSAGAIAALTVAWCYCLLAGWGIPARRTFLTLAITAGAALLRVPVAPSSILLLAACAVLVLDPWAPIAPGFWLSFGAVTVVLAWVHASREAVQDDTGIARRFLRTSLLATRLQCTVTAGLTPVLAFMTQQVAFASPLANAIAIPVVSLLVTPLALVCAALSSIPGAEALASWTGCAAEWLFRLLMVWIDWLAQREWAVWPVAAAPAALLGLAIAGVGWALLPAGMRSRRWGWLFMLPALCWKPLRPAPGDWRLVALDVGQGGAVVVETARHTLLFDAGPRHRNGSDGGQRVVWPYLRARGISRIDTLVLSHGDQDHAGGLDSILRAIPVTETYAPFDLEKRLRRDARARGYPHLAPMPRLMRSCRAGQNWEVDSVRYTFLHPSPEAARRSRGRSNAGGCVLLIQGSHHSALLPGDVDAASEHNFAATLPAVDVVIAPHHGSSTSSSARLIGAARARHVIAQVGYLNRFMHPAPAVRRRWVRAGAAFWRTDRDGALVVRSDAAGLSTRSYRHEARRYWHVRRGPQIDAHGSTEEASP